MDKQENFKLEEEVLSKYLEDIKTYLEHEEGDLNKLYETYQDIIKEASETQKLDERVEIMGIAAKSLSRKNYKMRRDFTERLRKISHSPYFARIDVKFADEKENKTAYIGKTAFQGYRLKKEITDWRSPIASIYYNYPFTTKNAVFHTTKWNALDSDKDHICELNLRRTLEIEDSKLLKIYDNDNLSNVDNEFLLTKLEAKSGGGLEDIIETIQQEQYEIIRFSPRKNIIVQGVAGSGKTTVAIHRISYIFYNFASDILPSETLFISNSKVLMNYLEKSLPELDVYNIKKTSTIEILRGVLEANQIKLRKKIHFAITKSGTNELLYTDVLLKGLEKFSKKANETLKDRFEITVLPDFTDASIFNMKNLWDRFSNLPTLERVNIILDDLKEAREELKKEVAINKKERLPIDNDLRKLQVVNLAITKISRFLGEVNIEGVYHDFLFSLDLKIPDQYDLGHVCALYYLAFNLGALKDLPDYKLVLVDEAQDMNVLNILCLKTLGKKAAFNLFGDLNQQIADGATLSSWDDVIKVLGLTESKLFSLKISYRSTKEIINKAAHILIQGGISQNIPQAVSRSGKPVVSREFDSSEEVIEDLLSEVKKLRERDFKSVGIILSSEFNPEEIKKKLSAKELESEILTYFFDNFKKDKIYLVPLDLVKGLEFESVFILDFMSPDFTVGKNAILKKFVAVTRAINNLWIYSITK